MLLGLDISTTATKALILDPDGEVKAIGRSPHTLQTPRAGWSEQDPEEWWQATRQATEQAIANAGCSPEDIRGIGLTGQMHGLVVLDSDHCVLRPAILWNDGRSEAECHDIRTVLGLKELVRLTGNDAYAGFTAPKLLWMRRHEPDLYARVAHVLLPKDFIRLRLTGELATDRAGAGGTLLLDIETRDWSRSVLDALDIPLSWMPPTHEGAEVTGMVSAQASEAIGLPKGIPVVAGAGDQAAQAVGVGATTTDTFALTIGTSGVVFAPTIRPMVDAMGRTHVFPHAIPDLWHVMGVMLSAAGSLQWYRDALAPTVSFDTLMDEASRVPAGGGDIIFLPYLSGERTPHANASARGSFTGLSLAHGRAHMTRAVLEGVAFGLKDNLNLLAESGLSPPESLQASGGALKHSLWQRIVADILEIPLVLTSVTEGAALGAAMLAGLGIGHWDTIAEATLTTLHDGPVVEPDERVAALHRETYARYRALYPALNAE